MKVSINANEVVRVKLTDHGREVHRKNHEDFLARLPPAARADCHYRPPKTDDRGWSDFQLWTLMKEFGPHMALGVRPLFEGLEIQIGDRN